MLTEHKHLYGKQDIVVGTERFSSFTSYLSSWLGHLDQSNQLFPSLLGHLNIFSAGNKLERLFKQVDSNALSNLEVFKPTGFTNNITPYSLFLLESITALSNIITRLQEPIIKHVSLMMSNPKDINKPWLDKDLILLNTGDLIEEYKIFFSKGNLKGEGSTTASFGTLYLSGKDFMRAGSNIENCTSVVGAIPLDKIKDNDVKLYTLVKSYIEIMRENVDMVPEDKYVIKKLTEALQAISVETELLSSLIYNFLVLKTAHDESADKIIKNLGG